MNFFALRAAISGAVLLAWSVAALAQAPSPAAPAAFAPVASAPAAYSGLGAASVAPEVIEKFRPKPLPEDISRRIQSLLDLRAPGGGRLTPDGKHMFFNWRVTGTDQVWRLDGPNAFPRQMTGGEDRTTLEAITPDGRYLVLQRDRKGEENPGLYLQSVEGGALIEVQHKPKVQTSFQAFSADGRFVYYSANDVRPDSYAIYRYDLAQRKAERVFDRPGTWALQAQRLQDGQEQLLLSRYTGSRSSEWFLYLPAKGELKPLLGQGERNSYQMSFGARADEYFVATSRFDDMTRLYRWHAARGTGEAAFERIAVGGAGAQRWEVEGFGIDFPKQRLYASINEAGYTRSYALDAHTLKPLALPFPKGLDHEALGAVSRDGRYVVLGYGWPNTPRESVVYDWRSGKTTRWLMPSVPEQDLSRFVPATLESYPARDGTAIPMFVRRPPACAAAAAPCPVIVHFHGGPEGQSRPGFSPIWQFFVDAGFIIVEPNVRGSSGYGLAWLDADNGPKRLNIITDIEDAALYIRKAWAKNGAAPKIGVYGGSYGGYSTLYAMTRFAGAYDAGVSNVGIANLLTFLQNTAPYRRALRASEYGDPVQDREALIQLSPTTYIDSLRSPLMVIQGANDPRVPVGEALLMHDAAQKRGVPVELMIFADEGHGASSRANIALQYGHTLRFFQQHLMGGGANLAASAPAAQ